MPRKSDSNVLQLRAKKRGRPRRDTVAIFLRVPRVEADLIDEWRKASREAMGRPEACRRLIRKALGKGGRQNVRALKRDQHMASLPKR